MPPVAPTPVGQPATGRPEPIAPRALPRFTAPGDGPVPIPAPVPATFGFPSVGLSDAPTTDLPITGGPTTKPPRATSTAGAVPVSGWRPVSAFGSPVEVGRSVSTSVRPVVAVPTAVDDPDEDFDEEFDPDDVAELSTGRSYTWLHLIVLALVAFVLGCVIILLLDHPIASSTGSAAQYTGSRTVDVGPSAL